MAIDWLQNESYIFVMISQSCFICDLSDYIIIRALYQMFLG